MSLALRRLVAAWLFSGLVAVLWPVTALAAPSEHCCAYPSLPDHGRTPSDFVPKGWKIEAQASGELEEGSRKGVAIILKKSVSPSPNLQGENNDKRILAVLVESPAHAYSLAVQNHTLIPTLPAQERQLIGLALGDGAKVPPLEIKRGSLLVHINMSFSAGPTAERDLTYSFRYGGERLYLVGYDEFVVGFSLGTVSNSYNFLTGKARISSGKDCAGRADVVAHCRYTPIWKGIKTQGPLTIEKIGDGTDFKPLTD